MQELFLSCKVKFVDMICGYNLWIFVIFLYRMNRLRLHDQIISRYLQIEKDKTIVF